MAATAEAVAKKVGCSTATVSRVLNGTGPVSRQTQEAVLKALHELGGVPRRRRTKRRAEGPWRAPATESGMIEIVMNVTSAIEHVEVHDGAVEVGPVTKVGPDEFFKPAYRLSNTHFRRLIDGAMDECARWKLRPVLHTTDRLDDNLLLGNLSKPDVQGLIMLGSDGPEIDAFLRRCPCRFVSLIGMGRNGWPYVATDDVPGMVQAIAKLASQGHRRIGYVAGAQHVPAFAHRLLAFRLAMNEVGVTVQEQWIYGASTHLADIAEGVGKILAGPADRRPTAFVCSFDSAAIGILRACEKLGLSVPKDLSLIGFGNHDIAELLRPGLTSIHAPVYELGRAAVKLLMMMQMDPAPADDGLSIRLPTSLVERSSVGSVPV